MTKKIRIAVACDYLGNYNAAGWGGPNLDSPDAEALWTSAAMEGLEPSGLDGLVWVEAEIPLPAEQTVAGTTVLERDQLREAREAGFEECEKLVTNMLLEAVKRNQGTADERAKTAADGEGVREIEIRIPAIRAQALREAAMAVRMGQARRSKPESKGGGE